ncbi:neutral/alkaline non-lysosomal ceramidase N-terminal domain-containing protein [Pontibacter sp. 13R65]|uniref:neutral/alkaline non-lysosomal ceramidase N-terminal domain-containing protein n=1 Tax=Pontibacter sp. 13R65 TaxID=3127458 RepID=UPI00301D1179
MMYKEKRTPLYLLIFTCLLLPSCIIQRIDRTPFQQAPYYQQTLEQLQAAPPTISEEDTLEVGWAKVNITPPLKTPLAGYGKRRGMKYTAIHDSVYVRTFAFRNGSNQAYFVALDMLITPMAVAAALEKEYPRLGLKPEQVYLSATHTHTSFGGWGKKLMGRLMAGKYKKQVVENTVSHILQSMKLAQARQEPTRFSYEEVSVSSLVGNRLTGNPAVLDTTLRFLQFKQKGGATAVLCTFSAHPTILPSMQPILSRDYPGPLVDSLETKVDFAAFSAGAVASHQTRAPYGDTFNSTAAVGKKLAGKILSRLNFACTTYHTRLAFARVPLHLPKPQWRSSTTHRFAPALFNIVFGNYPAFVNSLQIGPVVLLGVPADYSGEYMETLEATAQEQNQQVLLTGFNGGYLGYLTPEEHYDVKKYETRVMNFYGPFSGTFLTDILLRLLQQHKQAMPAQP